MINGMNRYDYLLYRSYMWRRMGKPQNAYTCRRMASRQALR